MWKLNAPGIAEGEFAILVLMLVQVSSAGQSRVVEHVFGVRGDDLEMLSDACQAWVSWLCKSSWRQPRQSKQKPRLTERGSAMELGDQ